MLSHFHNINIHINTALIIFSLCFAVFAYYPMFTNTYAIADDARTCTYWMRQFQDPDLFQNDLLTDYAKEYQPWGYIFLFYAFSFLMDPVVFSNYLTVFLLAVSGYYIFKVTHLYIEDNFLYLTRCIQYTGYDNILFQID